MGKVMASQFSLEDGLASYEVARGDLLFEFDSLNHYVKRRFEQAVFGEINRLTLLKEERVSPTSRLVLNQLLWHLARSEWFRFWFAAEQGQFEPHFHQLFEKFMQVIFCFYRAIF